MTSWSDAVVESMSTLELYAAMAHARQDGDWPDGLTERMAEEWRERPATDRIKAEAAMDGRLL